MDTMSGDKGPAAPKPLVSIGIPVYNGEPFIARALRSLLGQTVADVEVIVSDNSSTDGTQAICEDFAARDPRVRYVRQPKNIGAPRNWNAVVHLARGEFFKWASASDYCAPFMLERCVEAMRADRRIALCYGLTQFVDEDERPMRVYAGDIDVDEPRPSDRFLRVCSELKMFNAQSGVIRLDVLRRTWLDRSYPDGDMTLAEELALYGRLRLLPEVLLFRTQSPETHMYMKTPLERERILNPEATSVTKLIRGRRYLDRFRSIWCAPIPLAEKARASYGTLKRLYWERERLRGEVRSLFC